MPQTKKITLAIPLRHLLAHSPPTFDPNIKVMEQNMKQRLLECIDKVYDQSKDCKLDLAFLIPWLFSTLVIQLKK